MYCSYFTPSIQRCTSLAERVLCSCLCCFFLPYLLTSYRLSSYWAKFFISDVTWRTVTMIVFLNIFLIHFSLCLCSSSPWLLIPVYFFKPILAVLMKFFCRSGWFFFVFCVHYRTDSRGIGVLAFDSTRYHSHWATRRVVLLDTILTYFQQFTRGLLFQQQSVWSTLISLPYCISCLCINLSLFRILSSN